VLDAAVPAAAAAPIIEAPFVAGGTAPTAVCGPRFGVTVGAIAPAPAAVLGVTVDDVGAPLFEPASEPQLSAALADSMTLTWTAVSA
jgi:hypothetical protein